MEHFESGANLSWFFVFVEEFDHKTYESKKNKRNVPLLYIQIYEKTILSISISTLQRTYYQFSVFN